MRFPIRSGWRYGPSYRDVGFRKVRIGSSRAVASALSYHHRTGSHRSSTTAVFLRPERASAAPTGPPVRPLFLSTYEEAFCGLPQKVIHLFQLNSCILRFNPVSLLTRTEARSLPSPRFDRPNQCATNVPTRLPASHPPSWMRTGFHISLQPVSPLADLPTAIAR